jgi:hypothetical protein
LKDIHHLVENLKLLPNLDNLNINGNPVCKNPNFKTILLVNLPNIKILDGKPISSKFREDCQVKVKKQEGLLEILLSNYCELIKLHSVFKVILNILYINILYL